jgi:predicted nucleotidyltransferase
MNRVEATERIRELEPELRQLGVRSISIFGSVGRDSATSTSDLDLIAEFDFPHTFRQYFDTLLLLEERLHVHVDLAEPHTLHPKLKERILAEAVKVAYQSVPARRHLRESTED